MGKNLREGRKRRREKRLVADRQDFAFPHRSVYKLLFPALPAESLPAAEGSSPFTAAIVSLSKVSHHRTSICKASYLLHYITADNFFVENCIREAFKVPKYLV